MGGRKGFVQIEKGKVETGLLCPGYAQYAVCVGLIIAAKPSCFVNDFYEFCNLAVVNTRIFRIGDEQSGCTIRHRSF